MVLEAGTLAEVSVEVSADLTKLEAGFAKARDQAVKHNADMKRLTADQWSKIHLDRINKAMTDQQRAAAALIPTYQKNAAASRDRAEALRRSTARSMEEIAASRRAVAQLQAETVARARNAASMRGIGGGGPPVLVPPVGPMREAERGITAVGRAAGQATLLMRGFIGAVGIGLASRLGSVVTESLKATASIGDLAKAAGLTTTQFQEWRGVAMQLGIATKTIDQGMGEFAENVRQAAAGMDREERVFKKLGVSLKDADGNARSMNDVLLDTIDRLRDVHNPLQRGAALALLFGETVGPEMAKLVDAGKTEIENLREAVHDLGLVMSEQEIQKADETAKKLEQVSTVLSHEFAGTVVANADSIVKLAQALAAVTSAVVQFLGSNPGLAVTLLGALAGSMVGGIPGALLGGAGAYGVYRGSQDEYQQDDRKWFRHQFITEGERLKQMRADKGINDPGVQQQAARVRRIRDKFMAAGGTVPGVNDGTAKAAGGGIDLGDLFDREKKARAGAKGPKPKENIFEREEAQAAQERLRLLRASTVDLKRRNEIDHELIDYKLKERTAQINMQVSQGRLTKAQGQQLILEEQAQALMQKEAADREMRIDLIEQSTQRQQDLLDAEAGILQAAAQLARTDKQRNEIESSILRNKQQQELMEIDKAIAIARELEDQQKIADLTEIRRKTLERQGLETTGLAKSQLTGIEKFRDELPRTVDDINQQIDRIRFDKFMETLRRAAAMAEEIGDAFGRVAENLVADIKHPLKALKTLATDILGIFARNAQQQVADWAKDAIGGPIAARVFGGQLQQQGGLNTEQMNMALAVATSNLNALATAAASASFAMGGDGAAEAAGELAAGAGAAGAGLQQLDPQLAQFGNGLMSILSRFMGGGTGGGLGGLLKLGMSALGTAFGSGGLSGSGIDVANTGSLVPAGAPDMSGVLVDLPKFAGGGWVSGGTGRTDSNLIWADNGEHITNPDASRRFAPVLEGINSGLIPDVPALGRMLGGKTMGDAERQWRRLDMAALRLGGREGLTQNYYIQTKDADSFRRSERQIRSTGRRRLGVQ